MYFTGAHTCEETDYQVILVAGKLAWSVGIKRSVVVDFLSGALVVHAQAALTVGLRLIKYSEFATQIAIASP